jgi:ribosomal protein L7/L12
MDTRIENLIADFVAQKHAQGLTIVATMKAVCENFGIGLADAKQIVTAQPCWQRVVAASIPLQEQALEILEKTSGAAK